MVILDTNVISELMRPRPDPRVIAWVSAQPRSRLYTTSINQSEILYGIAVLPDGQRRAALAAAADAMFADDFSGRVLAYESAAAGHYAMIVAGRRRLGAPIDVFDAMIAAVAHAAAAPVATRDVGGFAGCDLDIIDPWTVDRAD